MVQVGCGLRNGAGAVQPFQKLSTEKEDWKQGDMF